MNSEKWFSLFALILQNMPALQAIFKKSEVKSDAKTSNEQVQR